MPLPVHFLLLKSLKIFTVGKTLVVPCEESLLRLIQEGRRRLRSQSTLVDTSYMIPIRKTVAVAIKILTLNMRWKQTREKYKLT